MAGSEGVGQTELLSGWSCVVHRPSEDPEPSELPSTVDMAAFSAGLSVEPTNTTQDDNNSDTESDSEADSTNSGSDASQSNSQSETSDSDSSSSSQDSSSRSPSPEFSVTSSQTNGLRLTIATVRKSCSSPTEKTTNKTSDSNKNTPVKSDHLSSSSDSPYSRSDSCSSDSDDTTSVAVKSDVVNSNKNVKSVKENTRKSIVKTRTKISDKKVDKRTVKKDINSSPKCSNNRVKPRQKRSKKMASLPLSRGSTCSSSDSDDSDADSAMLASCSLQEIRQEDLAAILPDQQECDAFGGFECRNDKTSPQAGDASGSDMELPQQAVNALIQRTTESSSESESHPPPNPNTLYANSLLQQFVAQTQLINNAPCSVPLQNSDVASSLTPALTSLETTSNNNSNNNNNNNSNNNNNTNDVDTVKRKRGRPRKSATHKTEMKNQTKPVLNGEYCGDPNVSPDSGIQNSPDHVSSPESSPLPNSKLKYHSKRSTGEGKQKIATETSKLLKSNMNPVVALTNTNINATTKLKEQHKLPVTSNRFDRLLYGNADRVLYPPRRKVGRPPISSRKGPGRPPKHRPIEIKPPDKTKNETEKIPATLKTAGKNDKTEHKSSKSMKLRDKDIVQLTSNTSSLTLGKPEQKINGLKEVPQKKSKSPMLFEICERVSKRLELNKFVQRSHVGNSKQQDMKNGGIKTKSSKNRVVLGTKNKNDRVKVKYTTLKNAKLMHSKHKKHKKYKFKILKPLTSTTHDPKINAEIEKLISDFVKFCSISSIKPAKENVPDVLKALKKVSKKRKTSEYNERKKKKQSVNNLLAKEASSNEQRLPLKKRHYHLSTNNDNKNELEEIKSQSLVDDGKVKSSPSTNNKTTTDKPKTVSTKQAIAPNTVSTSSPKASPQSNKISPVVKPNNNTKVSCLNNNYELSNDGSEIVGTHIDEAIEACITRYASVLEANMKHSKPVESPTKNDKPNVTSITATTPKKRHRLEINNSTNQVSDNVKKNESPTRKAEIENTEDAAKSKSKTTLETVVTELKIKKNVPSKPSESSQKKSEKKSETAAQINTRKKNRLEDLTSTLVSKINQTPAVETTDKRKKEESRASVIKYPSCKKSKVSADGEKLDFLDAKPTGIFMPTVDIELHIPTNTIPTNHSNEFLRNADFKENVNKSESPKQITNDKGQNKEKSEVESAKVMELFKKKIRKRRAINRTGFPTVKKKKKKFYSPETTLIEAEATQTVDSYNDRVPKSGEEYAKFMQRTERCSVSVIALEKLQKPYFSPAPPSEDNESVSKWEVLSECDSLPQDERTEIEVDDLKQDRMLLRPRDVSPATSVDTKSSEKSKHKRDSTPDSEEPLKTRAETERLKRKRGSDKNGARRSEDVLHRLSISKRKLRDISPASSIEPFTEKKLREEQACMSGDETKRNRKVPRWRKKYLVAGLFSDYYKEDDEATRQKRNEYITSKSRFIYKREEHPYGLLPPPYHCGKYLRCRKLPFQLPYDLWWQHTHSQLPGRDVVPSWNYRKIRSNIYNVKITTGACEPQACNCSSSTGCGDDCINRLVLAECPASHKCLNQKIQKHEWSPGLEKFMTENKGWGVRTKESIKNGDFILEYVGEVVSDQEFKERMATRYVHDTHHYCLHLDGGLVIDGHRMGGDGRFVNHSCQPNCEMQKWSVNGQFRMALFALRDIQSGEELTYDYNFSLFNPAEGQECKCGSENCRGVIGGKSQRVRQNNLSINITSNGNHNGRVGRPRKNQAKRTTSGPKEQPTIPLSAPILPTPQVKPMSHQQKCYVLEHHCFLLRNLNKVKRIRERSVGSTAMPRPQTATPTNQGATFLNHLNALQKPRNIKTRRLAQAEDDPEINKAAKIANFLRDLWNIVTTAKDENQDLLSSPFMNLPSKRKVPEYYQRITQPIDLINIEQNITMGNYRSPENFDDDMNRLFANNVRFYGRTSEMGICATRLKKIYIEAKCLSLSKFEELLGEKPPPSFISTKKKAEEEDVIRCICGMYRDEGLMIQCERCLVWQHCECVKADPSAASYHCERCVPREVDYEIALDEYTEHGHRYYMTLMRGTLQLRQGDTVYVLRDIPIPNSDKKHTYDTIGEIKYTDLDIFRIERLWKDSKNGQRFAYGHHYLRPHETYHEPTRKFFPNEVMRVPLYEAVPVELIISHCWVMDLNTFCKGRPFGAPEEHIYICEYRVDKTARLFSKISKNKFPICTKSYAFDRFDVRLKISRTYTPHDLDPALVKPRGRKPQENDDIREITRQPLPVHVPVIRTRGEQKARLNKILLNLLGKMPTKQPLDVSYLLEGGRRRKKQT